MYCAPAAVAECEPAIERHHPADNDAHMMAGRDKANSGLVLTSRCTNESGLRLAILGSAG